MCQLQHIIDYCKVMSTDRNKVWVALSVGPLFSMCAFDKNITQPLDSIAAIYSCELLQKVISQRKMGMCSHLAVYSLVVITNGFHCANSWHDKRNAGALI